MTSVDYLVVGGGAMGMAFADTILNETDKTVAIVDKHHRPGGHWNDSYPFVRLHQPSAFYGVNSRHLGNDTIDQTGWNEGLVELASGAEVCAYFDQVMQQQFLPSGRVEYFPMCEYVGNGRFVSSVTGEARAIDAKKVVDATYMNVTVPSTSGPKFDIAEGMRCVPLNDLVGLSERPNRYVVVGAGKTGMDACLWLLGNGVSAGEIVWVMPRDSWILDRALIQPGGFAERTLLAFAHQMVMVAEAETIDDLFARAEQTGQLLRLDPTVKPTMYRCATVTQKELEALRSIGTIVRQGRVRSIETDKMVLDEGEFAVTPDDLFIHCSADGLERRPVKPVFDGADITLQTVRTCQQVFSAAFIAHVEATYDDEAEKNELCTVVPHPNSDVDFLRTTLANSINGARWAQDERLSEWLANARLDGFSAPNVDASVRAEALEKVQASGMAAAAKLASFLSEVDA